MLCWWAQLPPQCPGLPSSLQWTESCVLKTRPGPRPGPRGALFDFTLPEELVVAIHIMAEWEVLVVVSCSRTDLLGQGSIPEPRNQRPGL